MTSGTCGGFFVAGTQTKVLSMMLSAPEATAVGAILANQKF